MNNDYRKQTTSSILKKYKIIHKEIPNKVPIEALNYCIFVKPISTQLGLQWKNDSNDFVYSYY